MLDICTKANNLNPFRYLEYVLTVMKDHQEDTDYRFMEDIGYGGLVYVLIGIVVPVVFTVVFCRFEGLRKLFGLPDLYGSIW